MKAILPLAVLFFPIVVAAAEPDAAPKATRLPENPILRPDMMPKNDGEWSGNLNFPSVIRVPAWIDKPLGKYYLYFSAHHGSYIRLAYADQVTGPWKIYEPGTLRLEQVEAVNKSERIKDAHVASPDVHVDDEHHQIRMYFHFLLPKLGHKGSVAISTDGLTFEPRAGVISNPYLRVFRRGGAYFGLDDRGILVRSPDGLAAFETVSEAVKDTASNAPRTEPGAARPAFRHGCVSLDGDELTVFFTRIGDAPERILFSRVRLGDDPATWKASTPAVILEPEREFEGTKAELVPSTFTGQTNVRQLRDPYVFRDGGKTYLLYAVAGETGIAIADVSGP